MIDFLNSDREKRTKSIRISMLFVLFLIMGFSLLSEMEFFAVPKNGISLNI